MPSYFVFPLANPHSGESLHNRAFIESFEFIEIIMYLFRQHTTGPSIFAISRKFFWLGRLLNAADSRF
jgi:hypothetical protein